MEEIKDLIIFLLIFIAVLWLQNNDDKKFNKPKRTSIYDIIKMPLFVSLVILIVKDLNFNLYEKFEGLFFNNNSLSNNNLSNNNLFGDNKLNNLFSNNNFNSNNLNDIFIEPPDF